MTNSQGREKNCSRVTISIFLFHGKNLTNWKIARIKNATNWRYEHPATKNEKEITDFFSRLTTCILLNFKNFKTSLLSEKQYCKSRQSAVLEKRCTQKFKAKVEVQEDKNLKNHWTFSPLIPPVYKIVWLHSMFTGFGIFVAIYVTANILRLFV